ncbi:MAG TPA: ROK family protein, partial [Agromyces sp.]
MHAIGIDIGGTKIAGAVVDELGAIVRSDRVPTPAGDAAALERAVVDMIAGLRGTDEIEAVGVAAAGFVDAAQSTLYYAPNIDWRNEPLREKLEAQVGGTVVIDNDANAAGWAEFRFGAGRLVSDMVMLTIGTGVGGAIVANDRLFRGGFGAGAELGHLRVVPDGLACGCGQRGCIEQYGSGRA